MKKIAAFVGFFWALSSGANQIYEAPPQVIDVTPDNIGEHPICMEFVAEDYGEGSVQYLATMAFPDSYKGLDFETLSAGDVYYPAGSPTVLVRPELNGDSRVISVVFGEAIPVSYKFEVLYGNPLYSPGEPKPEPYLFVLPLAPFTKDPLPETEASYCDAL